MTPQIVFNQAVDASVVVGFGFILSGGVIGIGKNAAPAGGGGISSKFADVTLDSISARRTRFSFSSFSMRTRSSSKTSEAETL